MRIVVMDLKTGTKEVFHFATAEPETNQGVISITDRRGNEHHFPTMGTVVMLNEDPDGFPGRLLRIVSRR